MNYTYLSETISFDVTRKKRKTIGIYINVYGHIEVRAPREICDETIIKFIEQKWHWIQEKVKEMKEKSAGYQEKKYVNGDTLLFLGKDYPIEVVVNDTLQQEKVIFQQTKFTITIKNYDIERIRTLLKRFFYQQCKSLVEGRIQHYQQYFKSKPRSIKISDNKSNWGSCNSKYELTFNWRLAMSPIEVIDYVVIHEMCHMVHLNHDRSFWRLVGKLDPSYEEHKKWLASTSWKMVL